MIRIALFIAILTCMLSISNQRTKADPQETVYYRIKCVKSQMVLSIEPGEQIIQRLPGPGERQQWKFIKKGKYYSIINRKTGMALKVKDGSKKAGTAVIQANADEDSESQQWSFVKIGAYYAIKARHSGLVLDVAKGSVERKDPLIQWPLKKNNNDNQLFTIESIK